MPKFVVIHHAHHADEERYYLVFGTAVEVNEMVEEPNPDYDPDFVVPEAPMLPQPFKPEPLTNGDVETGERLQAHMAAEEARYAEEREEYDRQWAELDVSRTQPTVMVPRTRTIVVEPQEITWDARDPKWKDREPEDIAAEQRAIVRDSITKRIAEAERLAAEAEAARTDLGGVGTEL